MSLASRKLIQATAGATTADTGDDDFANVVLLLDGDGTSGDANNTFTDSSTNGFTVTENGDVVQGSFSPYGDNWSNYFDGSGDYLTVSANSFNTGGTWTIECWAWWDSPNTGGNISATLINGLASDKLYFGYYSNVIYIGDNSTNNIAYSHTPEVGRWYHYALVKNGSTYTLYIDGTSVATSTTQLDTATLTSWQIGGRSAASSYWDGYISNMRVVNGTAVYTSDFTPSTSPLTAITNTSFLGCQSNRFKDNSTNNFSSTISGTPKVTPFSPFKDDDARDITTDGGSGYFGGDRDYLSLPSSTDFAFGTGDFTIEHWVFGGEQPDDYARTIAIGPVFSTGSVGTIFDDDDNLGKISFYARSLTTARILVSTSDINDNAWHHVAITRSSGVFRLFVDGVLEDTNSAYTASSVGTTTQPCVIGSVSSEVSGEDFQGYISDLRIIKGTALYTSSFTPPTAPPTAVTNTKLLLNFQDAGIYDRSGINNLDTVGNAQIDTAVVKYGTGSLEFDGSSDYLEIENTSELDLSGGKWTVECWVYPTAIYSTYRTIFTKRVSGIGTTSYQGYLRTSTGVVGYYNGTNYESSTALTSNQWSHCAWVYDGTNINIYVNGTSVLSSAVTMTEVDEPLVIGGARGYSEWFGGYIDDFRITKGIARYTSNFTAPADALPKF